MGTGYEVSSGRCKKIDEGPGDEACAGAYSKQWVCEMKNLAKGGTSGDMATAVASQNQFLLLAMGASVDELKLDQEKTQGMCQEQRH